VRNVVGTNQGTQPITVKTALGSCASSKFDVPHLTDCKPHCYFGEGEYQLDVSTSLSFQAPRRADVINIAVPDTTSTYRVEPIRRVMCRSIPSFCGRSRTNTRPSQIHRRRSILDSIPQHHRLNLSVIRTADRTEPLPRRVLARQGYSFLASITGNIPNYWTVKVSVVEAWAGTIGVF
jgi:hypothetical protein